MNYLVFVFIGSALVAFAIAIAAIILFGKQRKPHFSSHHHSSDGASVADSSDAPNSISGLVCSPLESQSHARQHSISKPLIQQQTSQQSPIPEMPLCSAFHQTDEKEDDVHLPVVYDSAVKQRCQHVYIMRHGERIDDVDSLWTSDRPFDPPLSNRGKHEALCIGHTLEHAKITHIITSPLLRCVQTASQVSEGMGYTGVIWADNGLMEVCSKGVIRNADGRPTTELCLSHLELLAHCPSFDPNARSPVEMPKWGETRGQGGTAHQRFINSFERIVDPFSPHCPNLLLVTHGDGLAAAVSLVLPEAMVFRTDYCGYIHLTRECGGWRLSSECGENGVEWIING
jgi:broad specificity phosphatase PhoE